MKTLSLLLLGILLFVAAISSTSAYDSDDALLDAVMDLLYDDMVESDAQSFAQKMCTTASLNVRSSPSTSAKIVKTLAPKTAVNVQSISGDWANIGSGQYVHKGYLGACAVQKMCTTASLNVRSSPSTSGKIVKTLAPNTAVNVQSISGDWANIASGQYVHKGYLGACGSTGGGTNCGMAYENGRALGNVNCVNINGKPVTTGTAAVFNTMKAAAARAGVNLHVNSGFRTHAEQQYFYNCYLTKKCNNGNLAAKPGFSNHQNGKALDIQTSGGAYAWLQNNASKYGFVRTVSSETWHWELRPGAKCNAYVKYTCK